MPQVELDRHFYLPNEVAWNSLMHLQERYAQDIVERYTNRHAWESILRVFFPQLCKEDNGLEYPLHGNSSAEAEILQIDFDSSQTKLQPGQTAQRTKYSVDGHLSDQGPPETDHGVGGGVTVERIITDLPAYTKHYRDILYVKCSPPSDRNDSQSRWIGAMRAAVASLGQRYVNQAVYFILGVGLEWLPFYWDPNGPTPAGQALRMVAGEDEGSGDGAPGWHEVSSKVRAPPGLDAEHVDVEGVIRTDRARSLDCFTVAQPGPAGEVPGLAFQEDLDFLEEFIGVVNRRAYVGENDADSE